MKSIENEWLLDQSIIHLNHAAVGPWPRRTVVAIEEFAKENARFGSQQYLKWIEKENALRNKFKQLINARSSAEIALLKNTSEGLSVIAYGLPWKRGDNIVISNEEFPSNRIVWESLTSRFGVEVRRADISHETPEQSLISECDKNTRLVSISSVPYASGTRIDLETIGDFCSASNILFCVDAIQSLGALTFDAQKCHADFVVADGHKWMLGPEGVALFYCREAVMDRLELNQFGWHMLAHAGEFDREDWEVAKSAKRFECGSPNSLGIHALDASLELLLEIGMTNVESEVLKRSQLLTQLIMEHGSLKLHSSLEDKRMSGIVNFSHRQEDTQQLFRTLQDQGVLCAQRGAGIRFSAHYYTPLVQLERAIDFCL